MKRLTLALVTLLAATANAQLGNLNAQNPFRSDSLENPYGAGNRFADGLLNPFSEHGSRYSNRSWNNPYATRPPQIRSRNTYYGEYSTNRYRQDSISNPYGRYGNPYYYGSIRNPYGAGNPYYRRPLYIRPAR